VTERNVKCHKLSVAGWRSLCLPPEPAFRCQSFRARVVVCFDKRRVCSQICPSVIFLQPEPAPVAQLGGKESEATKYTVKMFTVYNIFISKMRL